MIAPYVVDAAPWAGRHGWPTHPRDYRVEEGMGCGAIIAWPLIVDPRLAVAFIALIAARSVYPAADRLATVLDEERV